MMYCNVVLLSRPLSALTYRLEADVPIGAVVQVPVRQQSLTGIIVDKFDRRPTFPGAERVHFRTVIEVVDPKPFITEPLMRTFDFMSKYYYAPLGYCLRLALPAGMMRDGQCSYSIDLDAVEDFLTPCEKTDRRPSCESGKARAEWEAALRPIVAYARDRLAATGERENAKAPEMSVSEWSKKFGIPPQTVHAWISKGLFQPRWHLKKKRTSETLEAVYALALPEDSSGVTPPKLGKKQRAIVDFMRSQSGGVRHSALLAEFGACQSILARLESLGIVVKAMTTRDKTSFDDVESIVSQVDPTDEQREAIERISAHDGFGCFLLFGVTGSGKTEVYLSVMQRAVGVGKGCIFVLPEIALTPQFYAVFKGRFGDSVAVLHSGLGETERFNTWSRIRSGRAQVVIGPRSALFAPVQNLGLIVVDEEHDGSFKQGELPYYHARDMAIYLGQEAKCPVILGSATPSLESYWRVAQHRSEMIKLTRRPLARPMPNIEVVDMRNRLPKKNSNRVGRDGDRAPGASPCSDDNFSTYSNDKRQIGCNDEFHTDEAAEFETLRARILSPELESALRDTLSRGEQAIVFLNRRGYSTFIQCDYCGHSLTCPNCDVSLTYYKYSNEVRCHYCGYQESAPRRCSRCGREELSYSGFGTERVTALLSRVFPHARIDRLDRDRCSTKALQSVLGAFRKGKIDILVGTQMIAKGHDIPNVTLVGVVCADMGLNMPDFRSAERTYQLLTQVSGRAGRGNRPGRVVIQTLRPDHPAIAGQIDRDFENFARQELQIRRAIQKPPYVRLILVTFKGSQYLELERFALAYVRIAQNNMPRDEFAKILGPAPAPISVVAGEMRFQAYLQHTDRGVLHRWMTGILRQSEEMCKKAENFIQISIDVDPYDML